MTTLEAFWSFAEEQAAKFESTFLQVFDPIGLTLFRPLEPHWYEGITPQNRLVDKYKHEQYLLGIFRQRFGLTPWINIEKRFDTMQRLYWPLLELADEEI
jgi:hypothetical protein